MKYDLPSRLANNIAPKQRTQPFHSQFTRIINILHYDCWYWILYLSPGNVLLYELTPTERVDPSSLSRSSELYYYTEYLLKMAWWSLTPYF